MDTRPFFFKQFHLHHHRSTMKIGTDSIMLARWTEVSVDDEVLDVGTGCGLIPMMLAQKGIAHCDAVEIDHDSCEEAAENFIGTPWADKLAVIEDDVRHFAKTTNKKYDLVISNPPYFADFTKPDDARKGIARHTDNLSYSDLIDVATTLMKDDGRFVLVLPALEAKSFREKASEKGLFLRNELRIIPVEGRDFNRVNMRFTKNEGEIDTKYFTIRRADHSFTKEYYDFLDDYYLWIP